MNGQVRRVDDLIGHTAELIEACAFLANALDRRSLWRQGMRPARFAEPAYERRIRGIKKDQNGVQARHTRQLPVHSGEVGQELPFADVHDDGGLADDVFGPEGKFSERNEQGRGQVVDAEVSEVFECSNGL